MQLIHIHTDEPSSKILSLEAMATSQQGKWSLTKETKPVQTTLLTSSRMKNVDANLTSKCHYLQDQTLFSPEENDL